jgi:excinuclease ABC subunit A
MWMVAAIETCKGDGEVTEMQFMADVTLVCETCNETI